MRSDVLEEMRFVSKNTEDLKWGESREVKCINKNCNGKIIFVRSSYNGHICGRCTECDYLVMS